MDADPPPSALTAGSSNELAANNNNGCALDLVERTRNAEDGADMLSDYSDASRVSADDDLDAMLCPLETAAPSRGPPTGKGGGGGSSSSSAGADPAAALLLAWRGPSSRAPRRARTEVHQHKQQRQQQQQQMCTRPRPRPPPRTKHPHVHVGGSVGDATASSMSSAEDAAAPERATVAAKAMTTTEGEAEVADAFADLGVVTLRDEDEVEFGEGITMREEEEEQEINLGRDMFARSRNVAMIWGSTTSAVTPQASSSYSSATASSPASTRMSPHSPHPSSPTSESSPRVVLALPAATEPSVAAGTAPLAGAPAPTAAAVLRAVYILLSQPGARASSFATAMRALADRKDACSAASGGQHALESAAGVADGVLRRGGAAPPRPLPPASAAAPAVRWGARPSFSAALSLPLAAALVAAMFATAGDLSVRRTGRGAVELRVDDPSAKLCLLVDLRERRSGGSDRLIVDVRVRRAPCNPLATFLWQNRKQQRASYERAVADAESRWRALGCPAAPKDDGSRDKTKSTLAAIRIVATRGTFGVNQRQAISGGDARRHTMAI